MVVYLKSRKKRLRGFMVMVQACGGSRSPQLSAFEPSTGTAMRQAEGGLLAGQRGLGLHTGRGGGALCFAFFFFFFKKKTNLKLVHLYVWVSSQRNRVRALFRGQLCPRSAWPVLCFRADFSCHRCSRETFGHDIQKFGQALPPMSWFRVFFFWCVCVFLTPFHGRNLLKLFSCEVLPDPHWHRPPEQ